MALKPIVNGERHFRRAVVDPEIGPNGDRLRDAVDLLQCQQGGGLRRI